MKILLISGKARSGKDTFASCMKDILESYNKKVLVVHFADLLKFTCKTFFGWNGEKDEYGRDLLQRTGTDEIKAVYPRFWCGYIRRILEVYPNKWDYVLIPDLRFIDEIYEFRNFDAITIRIDRPYDGDLSSKQIQHRSEIALDNYPNFDYYILNDSTFENYEKKISDFVYKNILGPAERLIKTIDDGMVRMVLSDKP